MASSSTLAIIERHDKYRHALNEPIAPVRRKHYPFVDQYLGARGTIALESETENRHDEGRLKETPTP